MSQLFVFTAGNAATRAHLSDSITGPLDPAKVRPLATQTELARLDKAADEVGGLYAWGAEPGPKNAKTWSQMQPGDGVLCVYDNAYRFAATVVSTLHNPRMARAIWGIDEASGNTWEYMYLLTKPEAIDRPVAEVIDLLSRGYRGFTRIHPDRVAAIEDQFGDLETFMQTRITRGRTPPANDATDLLSVLSTYHQEGVVFESSSRGRRYRVLEVAPQGALIERVDGGESETITVAAYDQVITALRSSSSLELTDVQGNRIQGVTIAQASHLGISGNRKKLVDIRSKTDALTYFQDQLKALRVDRSDGVARLYKPVILDVVFRAAGNRELKDNRIEFDWLVPRFIDRMAELGVGADEKQAGYAFANLAGDIIWLLAYRDGETVIDGSSPSPAAVRQRVSHAKLKERLWELLGDPSTRDSLLNTLQQTWLTPTTEDEAMNFQDDLEKILGQYLTARREQFGGQHPMSAVFKRLKARIEAHPSVMDDPNLHVTASVGRGNWAKIPWIAITGAGHSIQSGVYCVYLFREDMSGVFATLNQGVTRPIRDHGRERGHAVLKGRAEKLRAHCEGLISPGFELNNEIDLKASPGYGRDYEASTVAHKLYDTGSVPPDSVLDEDLDALIKAYHNFLSSPDTAMLDDDDFGPSSASDFDLLDGVEEVLRFIEARGFTYEPWHIAQYITAIRTKPFVILAGITGTGKSKLPALVAEATGGRSHLVPVRPDWTDSSDVLGYTDLEGAFRPGKILSLVSEAMSDENRHWTCIVDEMNLARVEQYFAEVLSQMEDRREHDAGGFVSGPLLNQSVGDDDVEWAGVHLPPNLALVGTVNMDESAHGFSRKVLDRAFTLELSDVDLKDWKRTDNGKTHPAARWPTAAWHPRAIMLGHLSSLDEEEAAVINSTVDQLIEVNQFLRQAQLQIGYRSRDEIALFVLHARDIEGAFRDTAGNSVDPLDLALQMKILPRILGGSNSVRHLLREFLGWAHTGAPSSTDEEILDIVSSWKDSGRPDALDESDFPRTAARLCLMWDRLQLEGFTSFWS
jgi:5-methylcytosine-specific restriction enzyme B